MSSLFDAVIQSDNAEREPRSDEGAQRRRQARSSSRPRGPPSVSTPGLHSDMPAFEDDEVVGLRGNRRGPGQRLDIPPVVDTTGETLSLRFEDFLNEYVLSNRPNEHTH